MSDLPGGVITTHCVSTVVRPGSKQNHDPLQFVKIQSTELSQKAVEQIRLAEAVKITKEKIKEVEEEWQNNLLNWKSKRRQSRLTGGEESDSGDNQQRKIKTFSEILNEKAKSGQRIGYNLHKYIGMQDEEEEENLVITNNNNNNNDKRGSSRFSNGKNGSGDYLEDDDSNQFKNYEQQQAELQKKRQELNNKLQELEQLEKKQNELERQERINSPSSEISSPSPQLSSNTSETARNDSPTVIVSIENKERQSNLSTANVAKNCEIKQKQNDGYSDKKVFNFNSSSSELTKREEYNSVSSAHENRQKSVWNYLLQQQDDPRVVHHSHIDPNSDMNQPNLRPNSQYINADSESDDDHLNDSMDADEAAEKEQMLSFRAKLSTFESLSKSDASAQQQPSKQVKKSEKVKRTADQITSRLFPTTTSANSCSPSSSQTSSCTTLSAAATPTVSIQNLKDLENNSVIKNRPPTVEDLAHKEEMKVLQQRLQNQNIGEQQKHFHSTQQPTLPVNSINQNSHQKLHPIQQQANLDKSWNQNSPSHLPLNQMSKVCNPQVNNSNNSLVHPHQQHHYHSRTSSEETRESSSTWETSNFVCDKEVEKISERMNRGNVIPAEFGGNGHETITSTSVHYNNSGPPGLPATSMNQHYHSSSHLSHPHLLQQQRSQYGYDQVKMNRHSVPNLNGPGKEDMISNNIT
ncbi:myb-like protein P [Tetranychus urticae]|nr:myb-like protein P [Tetranychus urticae]